MVGDLLFVLPGALWSSADSFPTPLEGWTEPFFTSDPPRGPDVQTTVTTLVGFCHRIPGPMPGAYCPPTFMSPRRASWVAFQATWLVRGYEQREFVHLALWPWKGFFFRPG